MLYRVRMLAAALRPIAVLAAAVVLAALSGCVQTTEKPTPTPTAAATPAFASDEEALGAAEKAYAAYLAVDDAVLHDGGLNADRYEAVASGEALKASISNAEKFQAESVRTTGASSFRTEKLQATQFLGDGVTSVAVYVCDDVSGVDLLDSTGRSLVSPNRKPVAPFVITMERQNRTDRISQRELWTTENFCS